MFHRSTSVCAVLLLGAFARSQDAAPQRAVLVTGASSGIGLKTTQLLARSGFPVYAGARKQADLDMLDAIGNVESLRLDVTSPPPTSMR